LQKAILQLQSRVLEQTLLKEVISKKKKIFELNKLEGLYNSYNGPSNVPIWPL